MGVRTGGFRSLNDSPAHSCSPAGHNQLGVLFISPPLGLTEVAGAGVIDVASPSVGRWLWRGSNFLDFPPPSTDAACAADRCAGTSPASLALRKPKPALRTRLPPSWGRAPCAAARVLREPRPPSSSPAPRALQPVPPPGQPEGSRARAQATGRRARDARPRAERRKEPGRGAAHRARAAAAATLSARPGQPSRARALRRRRRRRFGCCSRCCRRRRWLAAALAPVGERSSERACVCFLKMAGAAAAVAAGAAAGAAAAAVSVEAPGRASAAPPPPPVYCVCRQPYDVNRFMIECDICKDWFHGR